MNELVTNNEETTLMESKTLLMSKDDLNSLNTIDGEYKHLIERVAALRAELRTVELAFKGIDTERKEVHTALATKYGLGEDHSIDRGTGVITFKKG